MRKIYVYITDETKSEENPGYDVDIYGDNDDQEDGRLDISRVGFSLKEAESYVEEIKTKYDVLCVRYQ